MSTAIPLYGSVKFGCVRWDCSRGYLYELLGAGKINAIRDGRRTKIEIASGDKYFSSLPQFSSTPEMPFGRRRKPKADAHFASLPLAESGARATSFDDESARRTNNERPKQASKRARPTVPPAVAR